MTKARQTNEQRSKATRKALIGAARRLFVANGYADTATPDIVRAASVTRGALYHHFADKADLFRAVIRAEFEAVSSEIDIASAEPESAMAALEAGGDGFIHAMRKPGRARLILLDGPAVLGRAEIDAIDAETSANSLKIGLQAAMDSGELISLPINALTALLSSMFDRAALAIADGEDEGPYRDTMRAVLSGLRQAKPGPD